jgi:hypothetical protein
MLLMINPAQTELGRSALASAADSIFSASLDWPCATRVKASWFSRTHAALMGAIP